MAPADFWPITPRETFLFIEAAGWREARQIRIAVTNAWYTAMFTNAKRLDSLGATLRKIFGSELDGSPGSGRGGKTLEEKAENARDWARRHNAKQAKIRAAEEARARG